MLDLICLTIKIAFYQQLFTGGRQTGSLTTTQKRISQLSLKMSNNNNNTVNPQDLSLPTLRQALQSGNAWAESVSQGLVSPVSSQLQQAQPRISSGKS